MRVSIRTNENWELGKAKPDVQAAALIMMVRQFPDITDRLSSLSISM